MKRVVEVESLVMKKYKWIRDISFAVRLFEQEYHEKILNTMIYKKGSCSGKHYLLGFFCEQLYLPVTYLTYPFYWSELNVKLPDDIKKLAEEMPLQYHLAIKVKLNPDKESIFFDATWDSPLAKAGFCVNRIKEKPENAQNAIVPYGKYMTHNSGIERDNYIRQIRKIIPNTEIEYKFYTTLNSWLEEIRKM